MDGYAFAGSELEQAQPDRPLMLRVVGTALAGGPWQGRLGAGQCVKIMTGAVMPVGADTVVAHEQASAEQECIQFDGHALRAGANRRLRGEDLEQGSVALQAGQRLTPAALGLLASLGLGQVSVRRRLSVAYFSTGDELLSPGAEPREEPSTTATASACRRCCAAWAPMCWTWGPCPMSRPRWKSACAKQPPWPMWC
jgi:molybdopterin molybdotransferase